MVEQFQIAAADRILAGALHVPARCTAAPWVVLCHGLFSSMTSEKFTALAERLSQAGLAALRFDFSGCGKSSGTIADTTVSRRLQELEAVVDFANNHTKLGGDCALMGSSLGGFTAFLFAARRPCKALSLWATPYELSAIKANIPAQDLQRLKPDFFADAARYRLDTLTTDIPIQVVHGTCDEVVPVNHADLLCSKNDPRHQHIIIPGADHSISSEQHRTIALDACCRWFTQHLNGS